MSAFGAMFADHPQHGVAVTRRIGAEIPGMAALVKKDGRGEAAWNCGVSQSTKPVGIASPAQGGVEVSERGEYVPVRYQRAGSPAEPRRLVRICPRIGEAAVAPIVNLSKIRNAGGRTREECE